MIDLDKLEKCLDELDKEKLNEDIESLVTLFQDHLKIKKSAPKGSQISFPPYNCVTYLGEDGTQALQKYQERGTYIPALASCPQTRKSMLSAGGAR